MPEYTKGLRQECGCTAGAVGLCAFGLLSAVVAVGDASPAAGELRPGAFLLLGGLFVVGLSVSALLGKLAGLCLAAVRDRRACDELERRARTLQAPG